MNNWYEKDLEGAVSFVLKYNCCFNWNVFSCAKTPCYDYAAEDISIPDGLRDAIRNYYRNLSRKERRELNGKIAFLLGERFFIREESIIKILSRVMADGDPRNNKDMIAISLQMQVKQRMELLKQLA